MCACYVCVCVVSLFFMCSSLCVCICVRCVCAVLVSWVRMLGVLAYELRVCVNAAYVFVANVCCLFVFVL